MFLVSKQDDESRVSLHEGTFNQKEVIQLLRSDPRIGFYYMVYAVPRNHELFSPYNLKLVLIIISFCIGKVLAHYFRHSPLFPFSITELLIILSLIRNVL